MAETKQLNFPLSEVATALVKMHGLHEGKWILGFEFELGAGNFGPSVTEVRPGAFAAIKNVLLTRQDAGAPDLPFTIDAAVINPTATTDAPKKSKKRG